MEANLLLFPFFLYIQFQVLNACNKPASPLPHNIVLQLFLRCTLCTCNMQDQSTAEEQVFSETIARKPSWPTRQDLLPLMPIMMPTYTAPTRAIPTVKATWGISTVGKKILPQFSATLETFRTYQEPIFSPPCGLFLIVPALGFAFCKQEELDYLGERLGKNSDYAKAVFGNNATSTMRIAMVMIHTVLHLVTSVSSLTCQKSKKEMNKKS